MNQDRGIRLNRNRRRFNKYGKIIAIIAILAGATIFSLLFIFKPSLFGLKQATKKPKVTTQQAQNQSSGTTSKTQNQSSNTTNEANSSNNSNSSNSSNTSTGEVNTTSSQNVGKSLKLEGTLEKETFNSEDFYEKSYFVGDVFFNSLDDYSFVDADRLASANFFTVGKAKDHIFEVSNKKPDKIFVMLGMDEANINKNPSVDKIVNRIGNYLVELKKHAKDSKIIVLSETPVSKKHESKSKVFLTQQMLDSINEGVEKKVLELGLTYIDIASVLKTNGYINPDISGNGYQIEKGYYPFVLNGIAKLLK